MVEHKNFAELAEKYCGEGFGVEKFETLWDFAIFNADEGNMALAIHVLKHLDENVEFYSYDFSMGMLEAPMPITCMEDLMDCLG